MAHSNQQRKRIRQDAKHTTANVARRSRVSTFIKKFEEALKSADKSAIATNFRAVMSELSKAAQKGAITKGSASRKISRLSARINTRA
ncbi:MAG: 30S ribosomal protein S20 [Proteobacteria bacterium]|nr:30S ribosomal protein S20 [Pseudomonadota bacterium]